MSNVPADLEYTKTHEWVRTLADGTVEIGITDHAQHALEHYRVRNFSSIST